MKPAPTLSDGTSKTFASTKTGKSAIPVSRPYDGAVACPAALPAINDSTLGTEPVFLQGATLPIPEPTADAARKGMHGILLKRHAALRLAGHSVFNVLRGTAPSSTGLHAGRSVATRPRRGARAQKPLGYDPLALGNVPHVHLWHVGLPANTCWPWQHAPLLAGEAGAHAPEQRVPTGLKLWRSVSLGALSRLSLTPGWLSWRHGRRRGVLRRHGRRLGRGSAGVRRPGRRVPTKLRGGVTDSELEALLWRLRRLRARLAAWSLLAWAGVGPSTGGAVPETSGWSVDSVFTTATALG